MQTLDTNVAPPMLETSYARHILIGLQGKQVYQRSVPESVIAQRRTANRRARAARRINR